MGVPPKPNRPPAWLVVLIGTFILLSVISLFWSDPITRAGGKAPTPVSLEDRVRAIAKTAATDSDLSGLNYEGIEIAGDQDDDGRATGQINVFAHYHLAEMPDADRDTARLAASLYRKIFALDRSIGLVSITFDGPIKDEYGHTDDRSYIDYEFTRLAFSKIDWNGFEAERLCALLRRESNGNSCGLWPGISTYGAEG
jgi:hypothetical protein